MFNPSNLGLAYRAGKLVFGVEMCVKAIQNNTAKIVLIASDSSENTIKKITDKANYYQVEYQILFDSKTLSTSIGKNNIKVVCLTDEGFKKMFTQK